MFTVMAINVLDQTALQMTKLVNETFRSFGSQALAHYRPMLILNISAPRNRQGVRLLSFDVT